MWAWRSFLSRPRRLLSRFRPVRRHASQPSAFLGNRGNNNLIHSRRYASNSDGESRAVAEAIRPKRHLYVVLDDQKDGYGIHKLDLNLDLEKDDEQDGGGQRLPDPPVLRVAFPGVDEITQFAALGSSIVAIYTSPAMNWSEKGDFGGVLIYDTKTASQVVSPELPKSLACGYGTAMAVGNRLYMIESCGNDLTASGLHCLTSDGDDNKLWGWQPFSPSSRWCWSNNENLFMLPFDACYITAHAVQVHARPDEAAPPQEHEIFVSTSRTPRSKLGATFSFVMPSRKWTHRGDWELPVAGHAHYDSELDTWVGLHAVEQYPRRTDGHLCTGHVTSAPSEWKVGTEKLFRPEEDMAAGWTHMETKLVPLTVGKDGSQYCLMERLRPQGDEDEECLGDGECLLRLTCFYVERGMHGEPVVADRRLARSYKFSRCNTCFDAQVFWM